MIVLRRAAHHVSLVEEHALVQLGMVVVLLGVQEPHEDDGADAEHEGRQQADAARTSAKGLSTCMRSRASLTRPCQVNATSSHAEVRSAGV